MCANDYPLEKFCRGVAREIGNGISTQRLEQYEAFLREQVVGADRRARPLRYVIPVFGVVAAVSVLALFFVFRAAPPSIRCWIGDETRPFGINERLTPTSGDITTLRFENGSRMDVRRGSTLRLKSSNAKDVRVDLENGSVAVDILRNGETTWTVSAGPFQVIVLGTKFTVEWRDEEGRLAVTVERGLVLVQGSRIIENGIKVAKGNRLEVNDRSGYLALQAVDGGPAFRMNQQNVKDNPNVNDDPDCSDTDNMAPSATTTESQPRDRAPDLGETPGSGRRKASRTAVKEATEPLLWTELYDRGQYEAAYRKAEKLDFDALTLSLDLELLWKLMHTARNTGQDRTAEKMLLAARLRFAGTPKSNRAAFLLGDMYATDNRNLVAASNWYQTYLRENVEGPLREEALGRLMVVYSRLGNPAAAADTAQRYLAQYTDGTFDASARSILKK